MTHVAVPIFFVISGYLFFLKSNTYSFIDYIAKLKSRFKTIFLPYIIWNIFSFLSIVFIKIGAFLLKDKPLSSIALFINEKGGFFNMLWNCTPLGNERFNFLGIDVTPYFPINVPMWFIRDLIIMVLITPILYWLIKKLRQYFIFLLGVIYLTYTFPSVSGISITALFFFSLGAFFAIQKKNIVDYFYSYNKISFVLAILFLLPTIYFGGKDGGFQGTLLYHFYILFGIVATFNLASYFVKQKQININKTLSDSTFFIFAMHTILVLRVSFFVTNKIFYGTSSFVLSIKYFTTPILAVVICVVLYYLLKKCFPRFTSIITGGR